jgi:Na+-translocating ferredoxin:NAD+ oxidoreductase subunit B
MFNGPLAVLIEQQLPQTQCTRCGFDGCKPYAQAVAAGTPANRCPPGGQALADNLARLLDRPALPLDPQYGQEQPRQVAHISEQECIGCTYCLPACPVDAIVGSAKKLHTIIVERCTGCELCIAPCPVACISMQAPPPHLSGWSTAQRDIALTDFARSTRVRERQKKTEKKASINPVKAAVKSTADESVAILARAALKAALDSAANK